MKVEDRNFNIGDLYIFTTTENPRAAAHKVLFGIYDATIDNKVLLEVASTDLRTFQVKLSLPAEYRYARRSTREELRLFSFNHGYYCAK